MGQIIDKIMGGDEGGGDAAVKRQAEGASNPMYALANLIGQVYAPFFPPGCLQNVLRHSQYASRLFKSRCKFNLCRDDVSPTDVSPTKNSWILRPLNYLPLGIIIPDPDVSQPWPA
jgi:hypothetical protein